MKSREFPENRSRLTMRIVLLLFASLLVNCASGQKSMKDSVVNFALLSPSYSMLIPAADLSQRFGVFNSIGASISYKTKTNWIIGLKPSFQFGNQVREDTMLDFLKDSEGRILGSDGRYGDLIFDQRGFTIDASVSRMIFKVGPNPNCGLFLEAGFGYWQHRIRVRELASKFPLLEGEYSIGFDRLTSGLMVSERVIYRYFSNSRLVNFFVGIELNQGFTEGRRSYQYDMKAAYDASRLDLSYGLCLGWSFPIYKRAPKEFYYE